MKQLFLTFNLVDILALLFFMLAWVGYAWRVEKQRDIDLSLTHKMAYYRHEWMKQMAGREVRIFDTQINGGLQNGTAFFASTSLFAIGGALTLLGATDKVFDILADLPFSFRPSKQLWEIKVFGLVSIFVYAFFKFAWAYRLFNYCSIIMGATPQMDKNGEPTEEMLKMAKKAAKMNTLGGAHFNKGQRAYFFALGYLGWFIHPFFFIYTTIVVVIVLWNRQFRSEALKALSDES